jgi:hypothetical protein
MRRHPEGRKLARVLFSVRVGRRDLVLFNPKWNAATHKVPRPYSGAEDSAPELNGVSG